MRRGKIGSNAHVLPCAPRLFAHFLLALLPLEAIFNGLLTFRYFKADRRVSADKLRC
jgi:hypothetical protein